MARGGKREGAGGRPGWKHGKTKTIRVPDVLADKIVEIARVLDEGTSLDIYSSPTVIDLTGVSILSSKHGPVVRLVDLLRVGYEIKPQALSRNLIPSLEKESKTMQSLEDLMSEAYDQQ